MLSRQKYVTKYIYIYNIFNREIGRKTEIPTFQKARACWDNRDEDIYEEESLRSSAERCHVCSELIKGQKH